MSTMSIWGMWISHVNECSICLKAAGMWDSEACCRIGKALYPERSALRRPGRDAPSLRGTIDRAYEKFQPNKED